MLSDELDPYPFPPLFWKFWWVAMASLFLFLVEVPYAVFGFGIGVFGMIGATIHQAKTWTEEDYARARKR